MPLSSIGDSSRFGPYEIRGQLGRGATGRVYRAWDPRLQREVALKVLVDRAGYQSDGVRRLVEEARAASALNHPNILTVFDVTVDQDTPCIVSELIDGESLREEIRRGPVPIKRLLDLATQIADGLADAHAAGIVHRDLKPENIAVTRAGRAKILDFGLARATGFQTPVAADTAQLSTDTLTEPGLLAGTIPYMSPEQARGSPTDFRSDQFSFALIVYEMATGQAAFRRETAAATLDAIVNDEPVPLPALNPQAPLWLWWILERCLAKGPAERYAATVDLHRDLRTLRDRFAQTLPGRPAADAARASRLSGGWLLAAILGLALVGAGGVVWSMSDNASPVDVSDLRFRALATGSSYEGLPAVSPDGQTIAYSAEVDGVLQIFTRRLSASAAARLTNAAYDCTHPFWAPDGKRIYYVSLARRREGIWSIGSAGGTPQVVVENASRAAVSPDGRTLAFLRDEEPADVVGTAALWFSTPPGAAPWSPDDVERAARRFDKFGAGRLIEGALAFSPDGSKLALCAVPDVTEPDMWQFWVIPLRGGEPYRRLRWWSEAAPRMSSLAWFPDSRHVVLAVASTVSRGTHLWVADLERDRAWALTRGADSELYPSASPAGDTVVFTRGEPDYDVLRVPLDGAAPSPFLATPHNESDASTSPDGRLMAYVTDRNGQDEIWLRTLEGDANAGDQPMITQRDFGDDQTVMLSSPAFSPDGQRIAYQRNASKPRWPLRIWISFVAGGAAAPLLPASQPGFQSAPTWSPDGQWIAFAQWKDRQWQLAKVRVGSSEGPVVLRSDGVANAAPHWSPRNDWITWETETGFVLVSPDGKQQRDLSQDQWLAHTWSRDGSRILGIRETDDLRLNLVSLLVPSGTETVLADLGRSFAFNNPVKGLALVNHERSILTSIVRPHGNLWVAAGLRWRSRLERTFPKFP